MTVAREFPVRDILTATTGRLLTKGEGPHDNGIDALYRLLEYMTGESPFTHQLGRFADECTRYILDQHPVLGSPEIDFVLGELVEMLKSPAVTCSQDKEYLIEGWLVRKVYPLVGAESLPLVPIPRDDHTSRDPLEELREMVPDATIVTVGDTSEEEGCDCGVAHLPD